MPKPTCYCRICGADKSIFLGLCDPCWELQRLVAAKPEAARLFLAGIDAARRGQQAG